MAEQILLVDDNAKLLKGIKLRLELLGYKVLLAYDGIDALEALECNHPDLIVADIMMPRMDGWELFEKVRSEPHLAAIPFIFLTARSDELSTHQGKALGAEDYISKPFNTRDLVASIQGRLRRASELAQLASQEPKSPLQDVIEVQNLRILPKARQAYLDESELELTPIEFGLLVHLAHHAGEVCPFERMARAVYPADYQPWKAQETLRVHINNLRRKLNSTEGENLISNVRGVGYRFETGSPTL